MDNKRDQSIWGSLVRWIKHHLFVQKKANYDPPRIVREYESVLTRLLMLERNQPWAIRTWRSIPRYQAGYDVLLTSDTLESLPFLPRTQPFNAEEFHRDQPPAFKGHPFATHRITVVRVYRIPVGGRIKIECVWMADLDLVGLSGMLKGNMYANAVVDAAARLLLKYEDSRLDWTDIFGQIVEYYIGSNHQPYPVTADEDIAGNKIEKIVTSYVRTNNLSR